MKVHTLIFDFDDTLVDTYHLFLSYYDRFVDAMAGIGFTDKEAVLSYLHAADIAAVSRIGHPAIESFPMALKDTYTHFCEEAGCPYDEETAASLQQIGWDVHRAEVPLLPDAVSVLDALHGRIPMILLTQGDLENQLRRVHQSGLERYFEECIVVPLKTEDVFRKLITERGLDPKSCCMIGNSLRTDINPAVAAGLQAIHLDVDDWAYDHVESKNDHITVDRLKSILEYIEL